MLHKRISVGRDDGDDLDDVTSTFWKVPPSSSQEELFASYVDDDTYTNWKFLLERSFIQKFLGGDPATLPLVNQLGLAQAFSIDYNCRPMIHAVREFALGFNSTGNYCDFRGRKLAFNTDVLRDAFLLPSGKCRFYLLGYNVLNREELTEMFGLYRRAEGASYKVSRLTGDYRSWAQAILTFQGLLLGMQSPFQLSVKRTGYFCAYLSNKVQPSDRPDWAELVHYHLKNELDKLKNHLKKRRSEIKTGSRFRCSCGTAVIRFLMHLGFTEEELSHATKKQRSEGGVPKVGSAGRVTPAKSTGMRDLRVVEEGQGPSTGGEKSASAASVDRCTDTKSSSSSGGANSESCEDGVPQDSSNESGNQDSNEEAIALSSGSSREVGIHVRNPKFRQLSQCSPVESGSRQSLESEDTSGGLGNVQEMSSEIQSRWTKANFDEKKKEILAIVTFMDAQNQEYAAELLEQKRKADAQFLKLKTECDNKLATLLSEKDKIKWERDTTLLELKALREEKKLLETAHETIHKNFEEEKEKSLCRICLESQKDTICLPCLHFHYCFSCFDTHSKRTRTCPTCRMPVNGEVRAHIWT